MKASKLLREWATITTLGCAALQAQMPPQPQVSFTEGSSGTWNADWEGVENRTYFVQYSLDLQTWDYLPVLLHGMGLQGTFVEAEGADKFFIRLKYLDDTSINTLEEAESADFDNDGLSNLEEVETIHTDPFNGDSDGDQMPDAWEHANGLDPTVNDAAGDLDGDGLTNLEEFQAQTKPGYYDSDGDQLGDGFEINTPGFNPLVYNDPNGDSDQDGLSDLGEMSNGTLANSPDSDSDGIFDTVELNSGTDPRDPNSKPFNHTSYFGGPIDPSMAPMGDLGVTFDTAGKFTLNLNLSDSLTWNPLNNRYQTEQEAWRVWMGNSKFVDTVPYPVPTDLGGGVISWRSPYQTPTGNITGDGSKIYELRLQHLGVAGVAHPNYPDDPSADYQHQLNFTSSGFLLTSNIPGDVVSRSIYRSTLQAGYNWEDHRVYAVPIASLGYSTSYAGSDATGPRFRKISHFGRPVPDAKPEAETESDEAAEESYVDAFDLSLHHDTSFASIPLAASDLRLEANASVRETTWSSRSGLRPHEEITSPFGISWSSNLCSYIETVETLGSSTTRPTSVNVVDEGGRGQRFGTSDNMTTFFPWPSSLTDKKTYLNELTTVGNDLILKKKFGNKLTYRPCDAWFMYSSDRLEYSPTVVRHRYWRLEEVEDRFGAKVQYDYGTNHFSLIPVEIRAVGRPSQRLTIARSTNGRRIDSITDAENNTTNFEYTDKTISIPSTTLSYPYQELAWVEFPGGAKENYTYEVLSDPETVGTRVTQHLHANLKSIQRDGYAQRVFTYGYDRTKKWYDHSLGRIAIGASMDSLPPDIEDRFKDYVEAINKVPQFNSAIRVQYGVPRMVTNISWPAMSIQASFSKTPDTLTKYGPEFSSVNGTNVTDATGKKYTYTFGGTHGEIIDTDSSQTGGTTSVSTEWLVYHSSTTLEYKDASDTLLGSETFEFDPDSGLSLKRTVDFCGKETVWNFDETRPVGPRITLANNPNFLTKWADPSKKTDALDRIENYEYGSHRMLTMLTDIHGAVTEYTVDDKGRRKDMTVKDSEGNLLQMEIYDYDSTTFPGFMTRKTRKAFSNLSGKAWEQDLVVEYEPDSYGRIWKEKVDPSGKNLVTTHTYDLNNQKETTLDPRSIKTTFEYDERNRLKKVIYASNSATSTFKTYGYDDNNAKIRETDENGYSTLIERDGLGRVEKSARDLNGNNEINLTDDIVTQYTHDAVGQVLAEIDPRGYATVTLRDDLHRPAHVFRGVPEASAGGTLASLSAMASSSREIAHDAFSYDITKKPGGGLLNPFKPTGTTRHNAVSMTHGQTDATLLDTAEYDDVYRPIQTNSEYKTGFYKTTHFNYGTVDGQGREPLVSTVTDSLGKVTQVTRDALGRETEIIDGVGNTDPDLVLTTTKHYTSTGLLWRTVDPLSRRTESEYDSVGRPVKVFQPDPSTGQITGSSPVTETEYDDDGNVSAVIDPLNRRTDFAYDLRNRKWQTQQPPVTNATNPDAPVANVRPTTTAFFDDAGNQIAVTDARGSTTRMFYDKANRLVKTRTNPQTGDPSDDPDAPGTNDITVTTNYDKGGLARSVEDGNGNITRNAYDGLARLIATATNPVNGNPATLAESGFDPASYRSSNSTTMLVSYVHDDAGNIVEVTDGESHQTAFTFDGFNRKTGIIWDPGKTLQRTETFEFNALVQTSRVDGKSHRTNYDFDDLYRLENVIYPGTSNPDNRHFTYDKAGKVLTVTYPNDPGSIRNVTSIYDKLDRLTSETSAGVTHTYPEYDKAGNRKQTTYGRTGTTLVCTYDALNRLETCEERSNATTPSGRTTIYAYDLGSKVTRKTLPNGNATTTTYDKVGRTLFMTERTSSLAVVSSFDYSQSVGSWPFSHDGVGNVLRCAENHTMANVPDRVVVNTYDHNNRLDTETITPTGGSAVATDYGYDLADNRVTKTVGSAVTAYQFGNGNNGANSNQLRSYGPSGQASTYSFSYDFNGNRSIRFDAAYNTNDYGWDDENRLISFRVEGASSIAPPGEEGSFTPPAEGSVFYYTYDHRGRRVVRDESAAGGVLTELTFSGGTSVQEANSTGTVQTELIRGSDWGGGVGGVLFTIRSGQRSYNAYNSRGDVVSTSGATGAATWQAAYEAFGTRTAEDGANDERQRANTKDEDPTGLLNEGHRYRDLDAGVFISRDPAGFVDGPNVYAYVRQNPWSAFDPEGLNMLNDINSMGNDWFGFWGGVGTGAANLATGIAKTAWNAHPAVNLGQFATGNKTGYQKQFEGGMALANTGYNLATSSEARVQALNAAANHVDAATKDPRKAGELAFNTVTTLATGAEAGMALYSKASGLVTATARGTQAVAKSEVAAIELQAKSPDYFRGAKPGELPDFAPRPHEFKVDDKGFVKPTHGVSVFDNPQSVASKGFTPHKIDNSTVPAELGVKQRGKDPRHYEITPQSDAKLTPEQYTEKLQEIRTKKQ
jgi:RHS repeat-associated protein